MSQTAVGTVTNLIDKNKAIASFLAPFVLSLGSVVASWIESGVWDGAESRTILAGLVTGVVTALATYSTKAGRAVVEVDAEIETEV